MEMRLTLLGCCILVLTGCAEPSLTPHPATVDGGRPRPAESLAGRFHLHLDPISMDAALTTLHAAQTARQRNLYDLDIAQFLGADDLKLQQLSFDVRGDLVATFLVRHPYQAPDLALPSSASNRADLGASFRLLLLADVASADVPASTFFGDVVVNTTAVRWASGYCDPGALLGDDPTLNATAFPYMIVVDEELSNRLEASAGGQPRGNYDDLPEGWQRATMDNSGVNNGWTGFDVLHQGQSALVDVTFSAAALDGGSSIDLDLAVLAKYQDPKGGSPQTDPAYRLPPVTADVDRFAYRLPHAAQDCSKVNHYFGTDTRATAAQGSTGTVQLAVRDWDAYAPETTAGDVGADPDVTTVEVGASGPPTVELSVPALSSTIFTGAATTGTGEAASEIAYPVTIANDLGTAPANRPLIGLARVTDPEGALIGRDSYTFGLDPDTLAPIPGGHLETITYQLVVVTLDPATPVGDYADDLPGSYLNGDPTNSVDSYDARQNQMSSALATRGQQVFQLCHDFSDPGTEYLRLKVSPDLGATWLDAIKPPTAGAEANQILGGSIAVLANGDLLILANERLSAPLTDDVIAIHATVAGDGTVSWDPSWTIIAGESLVACTRAISGDVVAHPTDPTKAYAAINYHDGCGPTLYRTRVLELTTGGGTIAVMSLGDANGALTDGESKEPQIALGSDGVIHAAWRYDTDDTPRYNRYETAAWMPVPEQVDTAQHSYNAVQELKVNSQNVPYVMFGRGSNDGFANRSRVWFGGRFGPGNWQTREVDQGSINGSNNESSMAIDLANDVIYCAFMRESYLFTDPGSIMYAIFPATLSVPIMAPTAINPDVAQDCDWPWIAFTRAGGGPLSVVTFEGANTPSHHEMGVLRISN